MKHILLILISGIFCAKAWGQTYNAGAVLDRYTDINPDKLMDYRTVPYTHETYAVDLFGDPAEDLEFTAHGAASSGGSDAYIRVRSLNPQVYITLGRIDSVYVPADSGWNVTRVAKPLNAGDDIDSPSALWDNTGLYLTDHSGHGGGNKNVNDWIAGEKFLGLKYNNGTRIDYGWVRIECISRDSCFIKDLSSSSLIAGREEKLTRSITLYPNPADNDVYLDHVKAGSFDISRLRITDIKGKGIEFTCVPSGERIKIELDPALPGGCYILQYFTDKEVFTRKLVKARPE
jgi:hypothetical protein